MHRLDGRFVYSASDLNAYVECRHLVELNRLVAFKERERPISSASSALIAAKGDLHERNHLEKMKTLYGDRLVSFEEDPQYGIDAMREAERLTIEAMEQGAAMIFQATFFDDQFYGRADFLRRVEIPSKRLAWSYEVIDTKLALSPKPYFLVQLCNYSEHLTRLLGTEPLNASIVLGSGIERTFRLADYAAYYRHLKSSFLVDVQTAVKTYQLPCKHCGVCAWSDECERQRMEDDHLSLVAFMRGDQVEKLESAGISTVAELAVASEAQRPKKMSEKSFWYLRSQAQEQNKQRLALKSSSSMPYSYSFRPAESGAGFEKLPEPQNGDVFFDIEGDPLYRPDRNLDYLFGFYLPDEGRYQEFWGLDFPQERVAFGQVIDFIMERRKKFPLMRVYHYAPYEKTSFGRLMGRYKLRETETNAFLRAGVLVDLYPIVRQALWVSQPSYGLKKLEKFYAVKRDTETKGGDDSIVMFESWLETQDPKTLEDIRQYNEDDCRSTHGLREWLVARRAEYVEQRQEPMSWPAYAPAGTPEPDGEPERTKLEAELLAGVRQFDSLADLRAAPDEQRARWILGNVAQYHRRDRRPSWMEYFQRLEHPDELEEDRCALAGLELCEDVAPYKQSPRARTLVHTYSFPPQEHYLGGTKPFWPYEKLLKPET
jgi:predicted RecB family nuclease